MNKETNKRKSEFELLKIILMLQILTLHYLRRALEGDIVLSDNVNYYIIRIIESFCIVAVNAFILITGYFAYEREKVKIGKVLNLFSILIFYNVCIYIISIITKITTFNLESLKEFVETCVTGGAWFVINYIVLYLLIPYINIIIKNINHKQFVVLLIIIILFFSIWPTFISGTTVRDGGYGITNFIMLYLMGAYIAKYNKNTRKAYIYFLVYIVMAIITYLISINVIKIHVSAFAYNSIFNIIGAVSLFLTFSKIKISSNIINKIAKHTFGIYIIHVNSFIAVPIWRDLLNSDKYYATKWFAINWIISVVITFLVCLIIDIVREKIYKYTIDKITKNNNIYNYEISVENKKEEKMYQKR